MNLYPSSFVKPQRAKITTYKRLKRVVTELRSDVLSGSKEMGKLNSTIRLPRGRVNKIHIGYGPCVGGINLSSMTPKRLYFIMVTYTRESSRTSSM